MAAPGPSQPGGRGGSQREPQLPRELTEALAASSDASERFALLSPSHRREYAKWVDEARREDARERRAAQTVMRLLEQR